MAHLHTEFDGARRGRQQSATGTTVDNTISDAGKVEYFDPVVVGLNTIQPLVKVEAFHDRTFQLSGIMGSVRVTSDSLNEIIAAIQLALDWSNDL